MSSPTARLGAINSANKSASKVPGLPAFQAQDDQGQRRFDLLNRLQSTLDLREQLGIFHQWLQPAVAIDSLAYHHEQQQIAITLGTQSPSTHRCNYRLSTDNECLGEVEFSRRQRFNEEELSQIETALTALLYPVRNALRYHVALQTALRDPLTGTGNRIALDNALRRECQLAERYAQSVSLLLLDIDHFKQINDNYGHSAGDQVLQQVAKKINQITRETDMTFRYGGEEFVVVLSKTDREGAALIAERIRQSIAAETFTSAAGDIQLTVSVGASSLRDQDNIKQLFDRTDEALYLAKDKGRNCVASL